MVHGCLGAVTVGFKCRAGTDAAAIEMVDVEDAHAAETESRAPMPSGDLWTTAEEL